MTRKSLMSSESRTDKWGRPKVGPIRHAPWSRWFKTFYCHGYFSRELQVGPLVFQFAHKYHQSTGRLHVWHDKYWRA